MDAIFIFAQLEFK